MTASGQPTDESLSPAEEVSADEDTTELDLGQLKAMGGLVEVRSLVVEPADDLTPSDESYFDPEDAPKHIVGPLARYSPHSGSADLFIGSTKHFSPHSHITDILRGIAGHVEAYSPAVDAVQHIVRQVRAESHITEIFRGIAGHVEAYSPAVDAVHQIARQVQAESHTTEIFRGIAGHVEAYSPAVDAVRQIARQVQAESHITEIFRGIAGHIKAYSPAVDAIRQIARQVRAESHITEIFRGIAGHVEAYSRMVEAINGLPRLLDTGHHIRTAMGLAAAALVEPQLGPIRVKDLALRSHLDSSASTNDIAHDVDTIVDALSSLAIETVVTHGIETVPQEHRSSSSVPARSRLSPAAPYQSGSLARIPTPSRAALRRPVKQVELRPVHVFCGSAKADERYRDVLMKHLSVIRHSGLVTMWHEGDLIPGEDWAAVTSYHLRIADLLLLLISADYIAELYERGLMHMLESKARHSQVAVVPILVNPTDYDGTFLADLSPLPTGGQPVTMWGHTEAAWTNVARGIRGVVETLRFQAHRLIG